MKNITVIGTGVIGTGWILRFLANGIKVKAFDKNSKQLNFLKDEINAKLESYGLKLGNVVKRPIDNLVQFNSEHKTF